MESVAAKIRLSYSWDLFNSSTCGFGIEIRNKDHVESLVSIGSGIPDIFYNNYDFAKNAVEKVRLVAL